MALVAAIDIGSNSVKMHVADVTEKTWIPISDHTEITRLSEGLKETGCITPLAMERTMHALERLVSHSRELGVARLVAVGTMCLREATNAAEFLEKVRNHLGLNVEVIDGDEEARLSYLALLSGLPLSERIVAFDTGGGSTEFMVGSGSTLDRRFSLNLGAVALTQEFLRSDPPTEAEVAALRAHLARSLVSLHPPGRRFTVVGIGGTVTSMAAVKAELPVYDPDRVHGSLLTRRDVEEQIRRYHQTPSLQRRAIVGLDPRRADIILAGAVIVWSVLSRLDVDHLLVSDRGLRHGLIFDRFVQGQ